MTALSDASGNVLAVVEAKRCSRSPREADEQLRHYVTEMLCEETVAVPQMCANTLDHASSLGDRTRPSQHLEMGMGNGFDC